MSELKINKRYKYAGDIFQHLIAIGFTSDEAISFLNNIKDADVASKSEVAVDIIENVRSILRGWCNSCYPLDVVFEQLIVMEKKYLEDKNENS